MSTTINSNPIPTPTDVLVDKAAPTSLEDLFNKLLLILD